MKKLPIIRNEMLDKILSFLLSLESPVINYQMKLLHGKEINMRFISELYENYDWDNDSWIQDSLKDELQHKEYIEKNESGLLFITEKGKDFIRKGGYSAIDKKENQEGIIREKTIEGFKYGTWGFWLSIISIIITIILSIIGIK